jgi:VWFA-related protein
MTRSCIAGAAVLLSVGIGASPAPHSQSAAQERRSFTARTTAVLVDIVVRDKKGRPVTDLSAADFELYEDGARQKVDSFSRVSRGGGIGLGLAWKSPADTVVITSTSDTSTSGAATPASNESDESTMALVLDHLSSETLQLVQRAALDSLPVAGEARARIGVFATGPGIRVLQRFTTDRTLVRAAVERALPSGMAAEERTSERHDELLARRRELMAGSEAAAGTVARGGAAQGTGSDPGQRDSELRLVQTELNMVRSFDNLNRDYRGYDTALGLQAIVQSLSAYRGRKTIVFFSEGLPVSPTLAARLDDIIDVANRANVTAYAIDANGLRTKSTLNHLRKEIEAFAEERLAQVAAGNDRTEQPLTMAFERVEDTLRLDSRTGLARLAEDTGGFLIEQTNDLSQAFRRIEEDSRFHYLLTYSPRNTTFDGKFRTIGVKVRRPGTEVFARKGYRALAAPSRVDTGSYEIPAVAMLDRTPLPNAFPVHASGFSFPDPARPGLTPVIVRVRTDALRFAVNAQRGTYSGQAAVLVRVRDGRGEEVQRLSQQYILTGEAKELDAARNGEILFYREVDLVPGVYTMESIVYDAASQQGSARVATLTVPSVEAAALGMSSLVLVNRVEEVSDAPAVPPIGRAPLYVGRTLVYPNLGEPIRKSQQSELPFYFALYGGRQNPQGHVQLLRNGEVLAETPLRLPTAPGTRVQHLGRLPIGSLPAGTFELRIRVTDATRELSQSAFFTLQD